MNIIFKGTHKEFIDTQKVILKIKNSFSSQCNIILNTQHGRDWQDLEESLMITLKDHFCYWDFQFKKIFEIAIECIISLNQELKLDRQNYKELLDNILRFEGRDKSDALAYQNAEKMLLNLRHLKDVIHVRKLRKKNHKVVQNNLMRDRRIKLRNQTETYEKNRVVEIKRLKYSITDAIENTIVQRRKEFRCLWTKYTKVARSIENLQHYETHRLKHLESKIKHNE